MKTIRSVWWCHVLVLKYTNFRSPPSISSSPPLVILNELSLRQLEINLLAFINEIKWIIKPYYFSPNLYQRQIICLRWIISLDINLVFRQVLAYLIDVLTGLRWLFQLKIYKTKQRWISVQFWLEETAPFLLPSLKPKIPLYSSHEFIPRQIIQIICLFLV